MRADSVIGFGCRLNIAESESIARLVGPDTVVVNSCAVTAEAEADARRAIRRLRRDRPGVRIVATGCAATIDPAGFAALADAVIPNDRKLDPAAYGAAAPAAAPARRHTRAFVPVQTGCDHRCTFCIIPYGRGPSRSEPAGAVVARIAAAVATGVQEVVLTGVDVTAWGADLPAGPSLGNLVGRILALVPDLPRLRLSSLDAVELDAQLIDLIAHEPRVMPHLHLSLQHGADLMLKRMKRRHTTAQAVALVARLKAARPEIAIGADLIAGFPTEDAAAHDANLAVLAAADVVQAHIFPFSPRPGTPAARMPQLPRPLIVERARALRHAAAARRAAWLAGLVGSVQDVLVESDGRSGHAPNHARVALAAPATPGRICPTRITARDGDQLIGIAA